MTNWTRAHDAWIAQECEGLEVSSDYGAEPHEIRFDGPWRPVAYYLTDPAAAIRAAEAWQTSGPDRRILLTIDLDGRRVDAYNGTHWFIVQDRALSAAIAQALYRATGGPA